MLNRRALRVMGLVVMAVGAGDFTANAAPPEGSSEQEPDYGIKQGSAFTIRLQLPLTQAVEWQQTSTSGSSSKDGGLTLLGGSLSRRFQNIIEAEAGAALVVNPCANGTQATVRLGVSPSLSSPTAQGSHWNVRLPVLASAHFVSMSGDGCDLPTRISRRVFDVASGIDATRWSASVTGFNLRLLVGYGPDGLTELALAMGMAF